MKSHRNTALLSAALSASILCGSISAQAETETPQKTTGTKAQEQTPAKKGQRPEAKKPLEIGQPVPADIALPTIDGKTRSFGDLRGKIVFVHFWSITCPWEKYAEPVIVELEKAYKGKPVVVLAINSNQNEIGPAPKPVKEGEDAEEGDKDEDAQGDAKDGDAGKKKQKPSQYAKLVAHVKKTEGFEHEALVDHGNTVSTLFGARTTPHCFVIDAKGVLRYAGALDGYAQDKKNPEAYVKNAIDALLAGKDVETTSTRPYG
ncbi:MAG: redoxin domain-containing protein [Planctomycetes bacterium]|nr:redoxin domain-containing protein [Planctomycetota bacterium]